jgi:hypothetical protein
MPPLTPDVRIDGEAPVVPQAAPLAKRLLRDDRVGSGESDRL